MNPSVRTLAVCVAWALACAGPSGPLPVPPPIPPGSPATNPDAPDVAAPGPATDTREGAPPASTPPSPTPSPGSPGEPSPTTPPGPSDPLVTEPATPPPTGAPPDAEGERKEPGPRPPGITQVNDHTFTVTQRLFERWKEDPFALGNATELGDGWELHQMRQSHGYHLGMRNKDVVVEVNGKRLGTQAQLIAAYLALRDDTVFDVAFVRQGKRRTVRVTVLP